MKPSTFRRQHEDKGTYLCYPEIMMKKDLLSNIPENLQTVFETMLNELEALKASNASLSMDNEFLREENRLLRYKLFGARSEKWRADDKVITLFDEVESLGDKPETDEETQDNEVDVPAHTRKRGHRKSLPADIPRIEIIHELPAEKQVCPNDGTPLKHIGEVVSEQLDIIPATIQVLQHKRKKYACECCQQFVVTAPLPPQPLPKSNASAGLLANITAAKYQNALPLYRHEEIFSEIGIELSRSTMARWMIECAHLAEPLVERMKQEILRCGVIHCDETTVQVLKEKGKKTSDKILHVGTCKRKINVFGVCFFICKQSLRRVCEWTTC